METNLYMQLYISYLIHIYNSVWRTLSSLDPFLAGGTLCYLHLASGMLQMKEIYNYYQLYMGSYKFHQNLSFLSLAWAVWLTNQNVLLLKRINMLFQFENLFSQPCFQSPNHIYQNKRDISTQELKNILWLHIDYIWTLKDL